MEKLHEISKKDLANVMGLFKKIDYMTMRQYMAVHDQKEWEDYTPLELQRRASEWEKLEKLKKYETAYVHECIVNVLFCDHADEVLAFLESQDDTAWKDEAYHAVYCMMKDRDLTTGNILEKFKEHYKNPLDKTPRWRR